MKNVFDKTRGENEVKTQLQSTDAKLFLDYLCSFLILLYMYFVWLRLGAIYTIPTKKS